MPESDIPGLTLRVLERMQEQLAALAPIKVAVESINARLDQTNGELHQTNLRLDRLTESTVDGFAQVDGRLDSIVKMIGGHYTDLETRVRVIEDHLGLGR